MKSFITILSGATLASAAVRGFNYGSEQGTADTFAAQFKTAAGLPGGNDFTSARLYTMIQQGTTTTPISAIQAAIDTNTTLLLGLWASVDEATFNNELEALSNAINQYGTKFADLVVGISVGSEDLYRISPIGITNKSGIGQSPDVLVNYINKVRDAIKGTILSTKLIGHVDTWNVYVNSSNNAVISACDWLGLDEYPYFQTTDSNAIESGGKLFFEAYDKVNNVAGGKPIWITEAGWPTSGPASNLAIASVENAETFWQDVGCELQRRNIPFWWYILSDSGASPSFGLSNDGVPVYNLTCLPKSSQSSSNGTEDSSTSGSPTSTGSSGGGSRTSGTSSPSGSQSGSSSSGTSSGSTTPNSGSSSGSPSSTGSTSTGGASQIAMSSFAGLVAIALLAAVAL